MADLVAALTDAATAASTAAEEARTAAERAQSAADADGSGPTQSAESHAVSLDPDDFEAIVSGVKEGLQPEDGYCRLGVNQAIRGGEAPGTGTADSLTARIIVADDHGRTFK